MKDELVIFKVSSFDRSELNRHVVNVVKRSQRGFRVVIGDDDNLETTLSPVPQMTPLKVSDQSTACKHRLSILLSYLLIDITGIG